MIFRKALVYTVLLSIYLTGTFVDTGFGFTVYWFYIPYFLLILFGVTSGKMDIKVMAVLIALAIWSVITTRVGLPLIIKQLFNVGFNVIAFYYLLRIEKFNFESIFKKYILVTKVVIALGLLQVALYVVGAGEFFKYVLFPFLADTNMGIRFQSVTAEPSFYVVAATPATFLALHNLFYGQRLFIGKIWSLVIIACYFLTMATTAFFAFGIMLLVLYFKNFTYTKLALSGFAIGFVLMAGIVAYNTVEEIKVRVDDVLTGVNGDFMKDDRYRRLHLSSYMTVTHMYVTIHSLKDYPLTGHGFGAHEVAYDKYLPNEMLLYSTMGRQDGGSLAFRLLTETGIIGFMVFIFFTLKYKVRSKKSFSDHEQFLWIINASVFVLIVLFLLRNGNYTINGKMLFLLMYYYSALALRRQWLPPYLKSDVVETDPVPSAA